MNKPQTEPSSNAPNRRPYTKPRLTSYGDIRDLTLAPTPGTQIESGRGAGRRTGRPTPP
jgi:hypothetical protein